LDKKPRRLRPTDVLGCNIHSRELRLFFLRSSLLIKPELIPRVDGACTRQLVNLMHNLSALDGGAQYSLARIYSLKVTSASEVTFFDNKGRPLIARVLFYAATKAFTKFKMIFASIFAPSRFGDLGKRDLSRAC